VVVSPWFVYSDPAVRTSYTLSLHDALPICGRGGPAVRLRQHQRGGGTAPDHRAAPVLHDDHDRAHDDNHGDPVDDGAARGRDPRSEEHTSELQSRENIVCRLLLEKKK